MGENTLSWLCSAQKWKDCFTEVASPFLFNMKSTLQQMILTAYRRLIKKVYYKTGKFDL